jgi:hypothetical protein
VKRCRVSFGEDGEVLVQGLRKLPVPLVWLQQWLGVKPKGRDVDSSICRGLPKVADYAYESDDFLLLNHNSKVELACVIAETSHSPVRTL